MLLHPDRRNIIRVYAQQALRDGGISGIPVDPFLLAIRLEIPLRDEQYDGVEGFLIRLGGVAGIGINSSIQYESRRRFTMAHELGHYYIHDDEQISCSSFDLNDWNSKRLEREANEFGSELMMPIDYFQKDVDSNFPSLKVFARLADEKYKTSLLATAVRFVRLTDEPIALVMSESRRVQWGMMSDGFPLKSEQLVTTLSMNSFAIDYYDGKALPEGPQDVRADAWFPAWDLEPDMLIREDSLAMPRLGRVLSLLSLPAAEYET